MQLSLGLDADPTLPRIRDRLIALQGPQRDAWRLDPTSQFVNAMISSCTWDAISSAAFVRLLAAFPSWKRLPESDPDIITPIIAPVTRAAEKARDLVGAARIIRARHGRFDLAFLAGWAVDDAFSWLDRIPGVGPKITAVTLNFSTLRHRTLAVDRHMLRSSKCLGLLPRTADFERGFRMLMRLIPNDWDADDLYELHWLMKTHSQTTCSRPQIIDICPLAPFCANAAVLTGNAYDTIL
jgi:endonuclease-3